MKTAAIILAAGRGSRMKNLTQFKPKCLLPLGNKALLDWQLEALRQVDDIMLVRGYRASDLRGLYKTVDNPAWESTGMLSSLLCAAPNANEFFAGGGDRLLVTNADIVYHPDHVAKMLTATADIAIAYDTLWENLWRLRFGDILAEAETFREEGGWLKEIGNKPEALEQIQGQYTGLLSCNKAGWERALAAAKALGQDAAQTDMSSFLRFLLAGGAAIRAVPIEGKWCECDSESDLRSYKNALEKGSWTHDWRTPQARRSAARRAQQ